MCERSFKLFDHKQGQILYGNTMLQFDANANVDASVILSSLIINSDLPSLTTTDPSHHQGVDYLPWNHWERSSHFRSFIIHLWRKTALTTSKHLYFSPIVARNVFWTWKDLDFFKARGSLLSWFTSWRLQFHFEKEKKRNGFYFLSISEFMVSCCLFKHTWFSYFVLDLFNL